MILILLRQLNKEKFLFEFCENSFWDFATFKRGLISKVLAIKVSSFRKQIILFSFEPKNERNCFLISALASKDGSNQKNRGTLLYYLWVFNIIDTFIFYLTYFRPLEQKSKKFVRFLVQKMRTRKFAFEIYWPLVQKRNAWD